MTALTGLVAWYKPETLAASYANGDPIDTWADSSGNGYDLTGTTTTRPLAAASAINGYMAADFDGTDDILSSASYSHSGQVVVSAVFNLDTLKNYNAIVNIDDSSTPVWPSSLLSNLIYSSGRFLCGIDLSGHKYLFQDSACSASTDYIATCGFNSSVGALASINGRYRVDSTLGTSPSTPTGTAYIHLGFAGIGGSYLNGKVTEVIIYTVADNSEVPWVEGYLADKYAITLADGHLFKNAAPENAPTTYNATGGATLASDARIERLK